MKITTTFNQILKEAFIGKVLTGYQYPGHPWVEANHKIRTLQFVTFSDGAYLDNPELLLIFEDESSLRINGNLKIEMEED